MAGKLLIVANWKMNGDTVSNAGLLESTAACARQCDAIDVVVCPTFLHIAQAVDILRNTPVGVGAQNVNEHAMGSYTGEVSIDMLREVGCEYVIVGHSERRQHYAETDEIVALRFKTACLGGIVPILCIGENAEQRAAGAAKEVVERQLDAISRTIENESGGRFVVAYEPIWAIGEGSHAATPEQVDEMHGVIHSKLLRLRGKERFSNIPVIYGGSVDRSNAKELFSLASVDGGLIGRASLQAQSFEAICYEAQTVAREQIED